MPSFEASNGPMPASSPSPFRAPLLRGKQDRSRYGLCPPDGANSLLPATSGENQTEDSWPNGRNLRSTVDLAGSIRLILSTSVDEREKLVPMEFVGAARTLRLAVPSRIHLFAYSRLGALVFNGLRACGYLLPRINMWVGRSNIR